MGDLGFNKIAAAILATGLGYMLLKEASHLVLHAESPSKPAYALEIPETNAAGGEDKPLPFPQADWVAALDATKGEKVFKKCASCHNVEKGGANGTGPNLWGTVGAAAGGKAGFKYSGALTSAGLTWDFETLDGFLAKPSKYLKGTNMNFVGVKKPADRAAVIAYLNANSDAPLPAPAAAVMEKAAIDDAQPAVQDAAVAVPAEIKTPTKINAPANITGAVKDAVAVPTIDAPKLDVPKVDVPKLDVPNTDALNIDVPDVPKTDIVEKAADTVGGVVGNVKDVVKDVPTLDVPKLDVPTLDTPKLDAPKIDVPTVDVPALDTPKLDVPNVDVKDAAKDVLDKAIEKVGE